jgi:hypothetical protein
MSAAGASAHHEPSTSAIASMSTMSAAYIGCRTIR